MWSCGLETGRAASIQIIFKLHEPLPSHPPITSIPPLPFHSFHSVPFGSVPLRSISFHPSTHPSIHHCRPCHLCHPSIHPAIHRTAGLFRPGLVRRPLQSLLSQSPSHLGGAVSAAEAAGAATGSADATGAAEGTGAGLRWRNRW